MSTTLCHSPKRSKCNKNYCLILTGNSNNQRNTHLSRKYAHGECITFLSTDENCTVSSLYDKWKCIIILIFSVELYTSPNETQRRWFSVSHNHHLNNRISFFALNKAMKLRYLLNYLDSLILVCYLWYWNRVYYYNNGIWNCESTSTFCTLAGSQADRSLSLMWTFSSKWNIVDCRIIQEGTGSVGDPRG